MNSLTIEKLIKDLNFLTLLTAEHTLDNIVSTDEISRPGIEITGHVEYFPYRRIQLFGYQEINYLESLPEAERHENMRKFLKKEIPLIVFARGLKPTKMFLDIANELDIPICCANQPTSKVFTLLYSYLEYELAPETQVHGVLMSIFGKGVLIKGKSGVGKSEVALELIHRGHYLVTDDSVVIRKTDEHTLIGMAPELLKNRLEIRGIGIVNIQKLYGITKVIQKKKIDLVVELKPMTGTEDRIGNGSKFETILDSEIPKIEIPVHAGRSISNMIEAAVANFELKKTYGYDSAQTFVDDLNRILTEKRK